MADNKRRRECDSIVGENSPFTSVTDKADTLTLTTTVSSKKMKQTTCTFMMIETLESKMMSNTKIDLVLKQF